MAGDARGVRLGVGVSPVAAASQLLQLFLGVVHGVPVASGSAQRPSPGAAQTLGCVWEQHPPGLDLLHGDNRVGTRNAGGSEQILRRPLELPAWIGPVCVSMNEDTDDGLIVAGDGIRDALDPA